MADILLPRHPVRRSRRPGPLAPGLSKRSTPPLSFTPPCGAGAGQREGSESWVPVFERAKRGMTTLGASGGLRLGAAAGKHLLSVLGGHSQEEAVAKGADETGR